MRVSAREARTRRGREVQIVVEDRGLGIPPADLPHIFEPFYRGSEAQSQQIHGNGLGLSIVRSIVEAHGGRVTVTSTPGKGSTFTMHIPVAEGEPAADAAAFRCSTASARVGFSGGGGGRQFRTPCQFRNPIAEFDAVHSCRVRPRPARSKTSPASCSR